MADTRKPTIAVSGLPMNIAGPMEAAKQSIEMMTGARPGMKELTGLTKDAGLVTVIEKLNEVIARLNASGRANV